jgi:hypothetical protein
MRQGLAEPSHHQLSLAQFCRGHRNLVFLAVVKRPAVFQGFQVGDERGVF